MPGAPVEGLPGGLLDRLARTRDDAVASPVVQHCLAGAWAAAARLAPAGPGSAWRALAVHGSVLGLPDGAAFSLSHAGPRLLDLVWETPTGGMAPADASESQVVDALQSLRNTRRALPPYVIDPGLVALGAGLPTGTSRLTTAWERVRDQRPDLAGHFELVLADLYHRAGAHAEALAAWQRAFDGLRSDVLGQACAALLLADTALAPFSSPLTWDCVVDLASGPGSDLQGAVEAREMGGAGVPDLDGAAQALDAADLLYGEAGHAWGQAAVRHRRAYAAMLADGPASAGPLFRDAADALADAGDRSGALLARVHGALAALAADDLPERPDTAADIAAWSRGDGGPGPGLALALLITRVGRHWLTDAPERAGAAFRIAEAVHAATDAPLQRSQALVDQAAAAGALGDRTAQRLLLLQALEVSDAAPVPDPGWDSPMAADDRRQRRALLMTALFNVGVAASDVPAMEQAAASLGADAEPEGGLLDGMPPAARRVAEALFATRDITGDVIGSAMRGQDAREAGDDDAADEHFRAAQVAIDAAPEDQRDQLQAFIAASRRDLPTAAAAYRRHLARQLAADDGALGGAGATPADPASEHPEHLRAAEGMWDALLLQRTRMLHMEGLHFFVRIRHPADARQQLEALRATADPWWSGLGPEWEHLRVQGQLEELEGDLDAAAASFRAAIGAAAQVRARLRRDDAKTAFGGNPAVQDLYRAAARVALRRRAQATTSGGEATALARAADAVRYAEDARSRALLDMLAANAAAASPDLEEAVPDWRAATAERRAAQDRLHALVARADAADEPVRAARQALEAADRAAADLEVRLRDRAPGFWASVSPEVDTSSIDEVAATLPPGTVVLQYSVQQPELLGWALTRDGMAAATWDVDQRTLGRAVSRLLDGYVDGVPESALVGTADDLARVLLEPFSAVLDVADHVVVVGSGPTLRLPFAALPWRGRPLGMDRTVTTAPSLSAMRYLRAAPAGTRLTTGGAAPAVVLGDPRGMALPGPDGPRPQRALPAAGLEARFVASLLPEAYLLVGADATEANLRAALPKAPLIHLATHGSLDPTSPLDSAVLLADGGMLTVAELVGMRLDADLVVLSACHSGEGAVVGGDDVLGLGRAILAAGAREAVLTLWSIDDISGALLMGEMYRRREGGESTATALRHAMGWLRGLDGEAADDALAALRAGILDAGEAVDTTRIDRARGVTRSTAVPAPYSHPRHWAPYVAVGAPVAVGSAV